MTFWPNNFSVLQIGSCLADSSKKNRGHHSMIHSIGDHLPLSSNPPKSSMSSSNSQISLKAKVCDTSDLNYEICNVIYDNCKWLSHLRFLQVAPVVPKSSNKQSGQKAVGRMDITSTNSPSVHKPSVITNINYNYTEKRGNL